MENVPKCQLEMRDAISQGPWLLLVRKNRGQPPWTTHVPRLLFSLREIKTLHIGVAILKCSVILRTVIVANATNSLAGTADLVTLNQRTHYIYNA